jgi:hypothetical protein
VGWQFWLSSRHEVVGAASKPELRFKLRAANQCTELGRSFPIAPEHEIEFFELCILSEKHPLNKKVQCESLSKDLDRRV